MSSSDDTRHVERLSDLGALEHVPVGTRVFVHEDGNDYTCTGNIALHIANNLGIPAACVWIPDHASTRIIARHRVFRSVAMCAHVLLTEPASVHRDNRMQSSFYFFQPASILREQNLLSSRSATYIDGVVELRHVTGGHLLRLFHLAPTDKNKGGEQLWP